MKFLIDCITAPSCPHKHKNYEIIAYLNGNGTFCSEEKDIYTSPGKFIIVPPGLTHSSKHSKDVERIYMSGDLNHIFSFYSPFIISDNREGAGISLAKMIYNNRYANSEYISALITAFAQFLTEVRISHACYLIHLYKDALSLTEISEKCGYTDYVYFSRRFKQTMGLSPKEYAST